MKKLILMLMISFSAMADDAYEAELKDRIANKDAIIEKLEELNADTEDLLERVFKQNSELMAKLRKESEPSNNYKLYLENISDMCLGGNNFASIGSDGSMYRFSCDLVEVVK
ncbi:MAG: hypothetical protein V7765_20980 [Oleispira sp.]